ncbi:NAD(P)H-dependent FAD/FMN reductase [Methyloligella halotolerans]|uniref:NAD(P)H-dependent FAD/FMN reductase n=1 Tax=Methyloligella halotolerans TaxID=1177755 RepID=A0A1E2S073_9HYPH|nr:NAD(P)H-dependent oxidoreductase [Methyloligella halotolerans]ODA67738.1 NAD(P)H-dependent FAD/FMN reductase [Methyloligella halotolerans]
MCLIVTVNGSPREGGRTGAVLRETADAVRRQLGESRLEEVSLAAEWKEIFSGLWRPQISDRAEQVVRQAEEADLLIVGSPIYRGSYTGLLKHYFDLVGREVMAGKKAIIIGTGGSPLHGLALEHQFRPLMGFFNIQTVATAVYGVESDFDDVEIRDDLLRARIERAAGEAARLLAVSKPAEPVMEAAL